MHLDIAVELDKKLNLFSELFGEKRSQRRLALQCNIPHGRSEDFIEMGAYLRFPVWYSSLTVPSVCFSWDPVNGLSLEHCAKPPRMNTTL